jgi:hypothetical protein
VSVATDPQIGLAPWNVSRSRLERNGSDVYVDGLPLVYYHFHSLRLFSGVAPVRRLGLLADRYRYSGPPARLAWRTNYPVHQLERELIWDPYLAALRRAVEDVRRVNDGRRAGVEHVAPSQVARELWEDVVPKGVREHSSRVAYTLRIGRRSRDTAAADA